MRVTLQYFEGCPHWKLADARLRKVLTELNSESVTLEYQKIDSPDTAERVGFHGSPSILVDGRDPFTSAYEAVGMSCRAYRTEDGVQGAPSETQLRQLLMPT